MPPFRFQLNYIDHYLTAPTRHDPVLRNDVAEEHQRFLPKVPVIRVFGITEGGQKVCGHVHGMFPYLMVEYKGGLGTKEVNFYIFKLHVSIDHALALVVKTSVPLPHCPLHLRDPKFVARITLVKGTPFYGFHVGYRLFLKIYLHNPGLMPRLTEMLQNGVVMATKFQPYEAHIQYIAQFMIDYNLFGCDWVNVGKVFFRGPVPMSEADLETELMTSGDTEGVPVIYNTSTVDPDLITEDFALPRLSHTPLEIDVLVPDILNRHCVPERPVHHTFSPPPPGTSPMLVPSLAALWKSEEDRRRAAMPAGSDSDASPFPPEVLASMGHNGGPLPQFINSEEQREWLAQLVEAEYDWRAEPKWGDFVEGQGKDDGVRTVWQSVEDLYEGNLRVALGLDQQTERPNQPRAEAEVDEVRLSQSQVVPEDDEDSDQRVNNDPGGSPTFSAEASEKVPEVTEGDVEMLVESFRGLAKSDLATSSALLEVPVDDWLLQLAGEERFSGQQVAEGVPFSQRKRRFMMSPGDGDGKRLRVETGDGGHDRATSKDGLVAFYDLGDPRDPLDTDGGAPALEVWTPSMKKNENGTRVSTDNPVAFNMTPGDSWVNFDDPFSARSPDVLSSLSERPRATPSAASDVSFMDFSSPMVRRNNLLSIPKWLGSVSFLMSQRSAAWPLSSPYPARRGTPGSTPRWQSSQSGGGRVISLRYSKPAPSVSEVYSTFAELGILEVVHQGPYYGDEREVPERPREYGGREFMIKGVTLPFLPMFNVGCYVDPGAERPSVQEMSRAGCGVRNWEYFPPPPSFDEVRRWAETETPPGDFRARRTWYRSQIKGPTLRKYSGVSASQRRPAAVITAEARSMSIMSVEVHTGMRGKLMADPEHDAVLMIFWSLQTDESYFHIADGLDPEPDRQGIVSGIIVVEDAELARTELSLRVQRQTGWIVDVEETELEALMTFAAVVRRYDPDIITGYELHGASWGYLLERASAFYEYDLSSDLSRVRADPAKGPTRPNRWVFTKTSTVKITGRHAINVWRAMRAEMALLSYTAENVTWHLLNRRIPHFTPAVLTAWWNLGTSPVASFTGGNRALSRLLRHYQVRTLLNLEILEVSELIPRTREQARVLGVDFFSVFSRGSQFKVESIMFRIAKPENFVFVLPSRRQVGGQNALECLPLVMEPRSGFYEDPVVVLDFQSLYPSIMIAYNYCYSTFAGRLVGIGKTGLNKMGFTEYQRPNRLLELLQPNVTISPNGMLFVPPTLRVSLLARMVQELLETRVMIKSGMKTAKDNKPLQQLLNNRQLALKFLANVTYGYTSASFSGRMPCAEIADAIVQTGRETLERAIALIHSRADWNAEVIYGDTDSLFIKLAGRSRESAFAIGHEIAVAITADNPRPVTLKFEKVYHPCLLLAKKRYVGHKYESPGQTVPAFDAKGIETVRRDGIPATQRVLERVITLLFNTKDLSCVKKYFTEQIDKTLAGKVAAKDFLFGKEVKLDTYSKNGTLPPAAYLAAKTLLQDPRAAMQYGERLPYLILSGAPDTKLNAKTVSLGTYLANPTAPIDYVYYITHMIIPPVDRVLNTLGASSKKWFAEMGKKQVTFQNPATTGLERYMAVSSCSVCRTKVSTPPKVGDAIVCHRCYSQRVASLISVQRRMSRMAKRITEQENICRECAGVTRGDEINCENWGCGLFWDGVRVKRKWGMEGRILEKAEGKLLDW